ncbi:MAG: hypothetical protein GXP08_07990 [Gammaproteobacteria bacterium]|nr:hypothetical protein [Gammaproteobacteria bacterium]
MITSCVSSVFGDELGRVLESLTAQRTLVSPNKLFLGERKRHDPVLAVGRPFGNVENTTVENAKVAEVASTVTGSSSQMVVGEKMASGASRLSPSLTPNVTASEAPHEDGLHDGSNDAITILQNPVEAMKDFPRDRRLEVDWVKTLDQGQIEPRADVNGKDEMETLDMDILMKNTQYMPWVKFPHSAHTKWLACSNCHPAIFSPQVGENPITMDKVLRGEYCGVCHGRVAFSLFVCERCHSIPHEGSGPKWW